MRSTYGYADTETGGRRQKQIISLSVFENGKVSRDGELIDLGTQLSRNTIKKALGGLEAKGLVVAQYECVQRNKSSKECFWKQDESYVVEETSSGAKCPRCGATLSKAWAIADLTPKKVVTLLNQHEKQAVAGAREWFFDHERKRFKFNDKEKAEQEARNLEILREEAIRLRGLLWDIEMVDKAVLIAEGILTKGNKISLSRRVNNFYKPVLDMQAKYNNPSLIKFALEKTIEAGVLGNPKNRTWFKYMDAVAKNHAAKFTGKQATNTNAAVAIEFSIEQREKTMRELLKQASKLNRTDTESARALLSDILAQVSDLAELFDGDKEMCDKSLREAFKQGASYFVGIKPKPLSSIDYYPEWNWNS